MIVRNILAALAVTCVAACGQPSPAPPGTGTEAQLDTPAPEAQPAQVLAPVNDAARAATGGLTAIVSLRLPDAGSNADPREVLSLRGESGLTLQAEISGAISPATQVGGQTLRALLDIAVEEPQVLVYRVLEERRPSNGEGICASSAPDFVVVWEPSGPGDPVMKILGVVGGAPGAAGARACALLAYRRT